MSNNPPSQGSPEIVVIVESEPGEIKITKRIVESESEHHAGHHPSFAEIKTARDAIALLQNDAHKTIIAVLMCLEAAMESYDEKLGTEDLIKEALARGVAVGVNSHETPELKESLKVRGLTGKVPVLTHFQDIRPFIANVLDAPGAA